MKVGFIMSNKKIPQSICLCTSKFSSTCPTLICLYRNKHIHTGGGKLVPDIFGAKSHRITREQKILVACLLLLLKNRREKRVTVLELFKCFKLELKSFNFDEVTESSCIGEIRLAQLATCQLVLNSKFSQNHILKVRIH